MWINKPVTVDDVSAMIEDAKRGVIVCDAPVTQAVLDALTEVVFAEHVNQALIDNVYKAFENTSAGVDGVLFKEFDESKVERDDHGRFATTGGLSSGMTDKQREVHAGKLAKEVAKKALAAEPGLTADMTRIAEQNGGQLHGLDYRMKSEDSLQRKILSDANAQYQGNVDKAAAAVGDANRYTVLANPAEYTSMVGATLDDLRREGYDVTNTKNYWQEGNAYKGINVAMVSPQGDRVELQFHTPQSSYLKEALNHPLYEAYRVLDDKSTPEAKALFNQMVAHSDTLDTPPGVYQVGILKGRERNLRWA